MKLLCPLSLHAINRFPFISVAFGCIDQETVGLGLLPLNHDKVPTHRGTGEFVHFLRLGVTSIFFAGAPDDPTRRHVSGTLNVLFFALCLL